MIVLIIFVLQEKLVAQLSPDSRRSARSALEHK
jgi:hypothetical protein